VRPREVRIVKYVTYMRDPNTAPPENVELIAPMVADASVVLKNVKKFGDWITRAMTPES
jgi:hypothetical protein